MTTQLILNHFRDTRNRSVKIWKGIPRDKYFWKPDEDAMHLLEQIRHQLKADKWFHFIIENRGDIKEYSVWNDERPYIDLQNELDFHESSTKRFWEYISTFSEDDLSNIKIFRADKKGAEWERSLGEYLLRVAFHEATHVGQMLANMRQAGIDRPYIWNDEEEK